METTSLATLRTEAQAADDKSYRAWLWWTTLADLGSDPVAATKAWENSEEFAKKAKEAMAKLDRKANEMTRGA